MSTWNEQVRSIEGIVNQIFMRRCTDFGNTTITRVYDKANNTITLQYENIARATITSVSGNWTGSFTVLLDTILTEASEHLRTEAGDYLVVE